MLRYGHNGSVHAFCLGLVVLSIGAALQGPESFRHLLRAERTDFRVIRPRRSSARGRRHGSQKSRSNRRKASRKK